MPATGPGGPSTNRPTEATSFETDLGLLFHRLNNQLGIILAHAELLESKAVDDANRARAGQLVSSALDAMGTTKAIRQLTTPAGA
jgi:hypothetical protein